MSITDELRGCIEDWSALIGKGGKIVLSNIADRIDAEYQKAKDEWVAKGGQSWLHGYEECRLELVEGNEAIAASLEEAGWVKLPLDADGVLIHIGDRMEHIELGYVCEVIAVGADCFIAWNTHLNRYCQYDSTLFRHYHEPTVEDVLREFTDAILDWAGKSGTVAETGTWSDIAAEYAVKLQLRSDGE